MEDPKFLFEGGGQGCFKKSIIILLFGDETKRDFLFLFWFGGSGWGGGGGLFNITSCDTQFI